jgi:hypothetical protein
MILKKNTCDSSEELDNRHIVCIRCEVRKAEVISAETGINIQWKKKSGKHSLPS